VFKYFRDKSLEKFTSFLSRALELNNEETEMLALLVSLCPDPSPNL
jgi:hypothetical protein